MMKTPDNISFVGAADISRIERALSVILSERHNANIKVKLNGKEEAKK